MGTRGCYGFRVNKTDKLTYNHYDSYPSWLGSEVLEFIKNTPDTELKVIAEKIELVDTEIPPTDEQKIICQNSGIVDLNVSEQSLNDWYCLLRGSQGDLEVYKKGFTLMSDSKGFMGDSLFCEYAYIINVDEGVLEFYEGFQKNQQRGNRFMKYVRAGCEYKSVRLIKKIPFSEIRELELTEDVVTKLLK